MTDRETLQESSIPVSVRVSMITLAETGMYLEASGYNPRSMSELVANGLYLLCEILRSNDKKFIQVGSVIAAHEWLSMKRLYQQSMNKKSLCKVANAIRFESMRNEGLDPQTEDPRGFRMVHKSSAVNPLTITREDVLDEYDRMLKMAREANEKEAEAEKQKQIEKARNGNLIKNESKGDSNEN
jgi:hypothetical protein